MERLTQKLKIQKRELSICLENLFNGNLNIFHRSGPKAPDTYPHPETCIRILLSTFLNEKIVNQFKWFLKPDPGIRLLWSKSSTTLHCIGLQSTTKSCLIFTWLPTQKFHFSKIRVIWLIRGKYDDLLWKSANIIGKRWENRGGKFSLYLEESNFFWKEGEGQK